jgi:hypothetical protein
MTVQADIVQFGRYCDCSLPITWPQKSIRQRFDEMSVGIFDTLTFLSLEEGDEVVREGHFKQRFASVTNTLYERPFIGNTEMPLSAEPP